MIDDFRLVAATGNQGKIREFQQLLENLPVRLQSLSDFPGIVEPEETGATFVENAILKARYYALKTNSRSMADDSGLEVEALGGAPGVLSARYAGENATDAEKISKLLNALGESATRDRRAQFVCAIAVADARGETEFVAEGVCRGAIAITSRGSNGFGYDPIFIPDGYSETFAEMSADIKQRISHRARATAEIIQYLRGIYAATS